MTELQHIREVRTSLPRRVVDGDTWWCYIDQGYRQLGYFEYRLFGWDTPEKQGPEVTAMEKAKAKSATEVAAGWWFAQIKAGGRRIFVESQPDPEKYGRWLGVLWAETLTGEKFYLGEHLASLDLAVPSNGTKGTRWRDTYNPWRTP